MINWFHRWLHPHCPDCKEERLDSLICESCNTLRQENHALRKHNEQLINSLLDQLRPKEEVIISQPIEQPKPFNTMMPWRARKHILETEDKRAAEVLREKRKEMEAVPVTKAVEELEKELEING